MNGWPAPTGERAYECMWAHGSCHDETPPPPATWILIGESGDYAECDYHHARRIESEPHWRRIQATDQQGAAR